MYQNLKVLLVDDDALSRRLLTRSLEESGFEVIDCRDGVEALQILEDTGPAMLVLDYEMPEFNGAQICEIVRSSKDPAIAQVPVIFLTAHSGEDHEVECLQAGADDFVTKPVTMPVLKARIETHLRLHALRNQLQKQNRELEKWREIHELDLDHARLTQQAILPASAPDFRGWRIAARYQPLIQVGGDMFGYLKLHNDSLLIWMADATGHGASAALLTTLATLLFRHAVAQQSDVGELMKSVNSDFYGVFRGRAFMSTLCVALASDSGEISCCGAGHPPLLIIRRDGTTKSLESAIPPIGLSRDTEVRKSSAELETGDALLMYTDGLYGMSGPGGTRIEPRDLTAMLPDRIREPETFLDRLFERVRSRAKNGEFADDATAIIAMRSGV